MTEDTNVYDNKFQIKYNRSHAIHRDNWMINKQKMYFVIFNFCVECLFKGIRLKQPRL